MQILPALSEPRTALPSPACSPFARLSNRQVNRETSPASEKTFYIETFGCQMNVHDSEKVAGALLARGYRWVDNYEDADLILYNTCSIREKAAQKVFSRLGAFKKAYRNSQKTIGVLGCVAQQEGERIFDRAPQVNLVCGSASYSRIGDLIERIEAGERRVTGLSLDTDECFETEITRRDNPFRAYLTIIEGCDKACTYCVVPRTRGPERSRPSDKILAEARRLAAEGFSEIQLLGQTVNSYHDPSTARLSFTDLLLRAAKIPGLRRLRFTTSHPKDFTPEIVQAIESSPVLCDHVHLPVQCGSNAVLRRMNRTYTREEYLEKIGCIRRAKRAISISTDMIVGFCGETEEDFEGTLCLLDEVEYDQVFSFKYSPRPATAAGRMEDSIPEEEKGRRLTALQERQREIQLRRNRSLEGREFEVLVEGFQPKLQQAVGRTSGNRIINFPGEAGWAGRYMTVRVTAAGPNSLVGVRTGSV
ncbi:MAG TPA: tRNA (N6-isopentenyl adenosine(37)-C2)-methylthiotransferase MiaB [Terriglobia bacterium]|nr:tRNA (N6-isopentenyl adenosine(37)-C2)-methylthiotransferase MiaB [Terriglobia bacterium]